MKAIELKNVCFEYDLLDDETIKAVDNVTLSIEEGAYIALIGHNGSGKSTFAKLLNGLIIPYSGDVLVYGVNTNEKKSIFDVRKNVGMVFQNPDNQMIASIVEDDIAFGPENLGVERSEIIRRVEWALGVVGMSEHKKSTPFKMSGGQKQRIAIAGVLAMLPKILVLDESTAMLDPKGRSEIMAVAQKLNKEMGITVINITHYMDEALQADRLLVMNEGRIVCDGEPIEVFSNYERMKEINLSIPTVTSYANKLRKMGLDMPANIMNEEEFVEALCQLL